jgi:formylglycine-generating enzyme required for sulfatase activity
MPFFYPRRPANLRRVLMLVVLAALTAAGGPVQAAELRVSDGEVVVKEGVAYVEVDVSWRLSWRNDTNWDAVWLVAKVQGSSRTDIHVPLAPSGHRMVDNAAPDRPGAVVEGTADSMGVFVYRDAATDGRGPNDWTLRLKMALPDEVSPQDLPTPVHVHGVEMVYVPTGPFSLGDPQGVNGPDEAFFEISSDSSGTYRVSDSGPIPLCDGPGTLCDTETSEEDGPGLIPASYPNGYDAFYLMKYELTQGQYAAFLNGRSKRQTAQHDIIAGRNYDRMRGSIALVGDRYVAGRPDRACNFLSWGNAAAYADWAGLRPMTDLEYTKAARGPANPVHNEFAWGSTTIAHGDTLFNPDTTLARGEDGDEFVRGNANYSPATASWKRGYGATFVGGDGGAGPLRVDIFETHAYRTDAPNKREASGAGYYGALDLSGSLYERVVTATDTTGHRFRGSHGDGDLSYPGWATNADWPTRDGDGLGLRGGATSGYASGIRLARRIYADYEGSYRFGMGGFRAARTAPNEVRK